MNRHKSRTRLAALAASVGATVAIAALGGATSAMAATCPTAPGFSSGSSLQNNAQSLFLSGWAGHTACAPNPTITYSGTSSGQGLNEFGNVSGVLNTEEDAAANGSATGLKDNEGQVLDWYVGTDDPPNTGNLANAISASGDKHGNLEEITLPVAQAPVAVMLSLPHGCLVPTGSEIDLDGKTLSQIWLGNRPEEAAEDSPGGIAAQGSPVLYPADTWGALLTQLGYKEEKTENPPINPEEFYSASGACEQPITLQARSAYSGTTYAFKNYLYLDDDDLYYSTVSHQFATSNIWGGFISDAPEWPATVSTTGNPKGSSLVKDTAKTPGSIGYANTSDAVSPSDGGFTHGAKESTWEGSESHQILYAQIQNNVAFSTKDEAEHVKPVKTYSDPVETGTEIANCETDKLLAGDKSPPYSYTDSWYGITAEDPNLGVDDTSGDWYPICALTYDLVWRHYNAGDLFPTAHAEEIAKAVKSLFEYVTGPFGQEAIKADYYTGIPSSSVWTSHIKLGVTAIEG